MVKAPKSNLTERGTMEFLKLKNVGWFSLKNKKK